MSLLRGCLLVLGLAVAAPVLAADWGISVGVTPRYYSSYYYPYRYYAPYCYPYYRPYYYSRPYYYCSPFSFNFGYYPRYPHRNHHWRHW